jgi:hypothetical protein
MCSSNVIFLIPLVDEMCFLQYSCPLSRWYVFLRSNLHVLWVFFLFDQIFYFMHWVVFFMWADFLFILVIICLFLHRDFIYCQTAQVDSVYRSRSSLHLNTAKKEKYKKISVLSNCGVKKATELLSMQNRIRGWTRRVHCMLLNKFVPLRFLLHVNDTTRTPGKWVHQNRTEEAAASATRTSTHAWDWDTVCTNQLVPPRNLRKNETGLNSSFRLDVSCNLAPRGWKTRHRTEL